MEIHSAVWRAAAAAASVPGPATATTPGPTTGREDQAGDQKRFEEVLGRPKLDADVPPESIARDDAIAAAHSIDPADMASPTGSMDCLGDEILRSVDQAH